jgi:protein-arginine kinase activator protein McsA
MIMRIDIDNKHYDIDFLERRLIFLIESEEYEKAVVIRRWIDELVYYHHGITPEELFELIKF